MRAGQITEIVSGQRIPNLLIQTGMHNRTVVLDLAAGLCRES